MELLQIRLNYKVMRKEGKKGRKGGRKEKRRKEGREGKGRAGNERKKEEGREGERGKEKAREK